ncbi:sulfurtransferase TusA family protein [Tepidiforma bonchosmolovskayae]|uniref:Sulfurtransferase TusA family protein n=2 Tax=Tepidiforma bonchosmolovskayae TaxID=2601677 RepID=A0ABX6C3V1_9CHLR|nr:sulfurtransferase TusA family protein [Tepidiforma bonchosmolovskayae]
MGKEGTMELDVRGEMCPYPAMKAREALAKLPAGECLEVLTDHAPALSTVPWEGAKLNYRSTIEPVGRGTWRIRLEPAEGTLDQKKALAEIAQRAAELSKS